MYPYFAIKHDLFLAAADHDIGMLFQAARDSAIGAPRPWLARLSTMLNRPEDHPLLTRVLGEESPEIAEQCLQLPSVRSFLADLETDLTAANDLGLLRPGLDLPSTIEGLETIFVALLVLKIRGGQHFVTRLPSVAQLLAHLLINDPE